MLSRCNKFVCCREQVHTFFSSSAKRRSVLKSFLDPESTERKYMTPGGKNMQRYFNWNSVMDALHNILTNESDNDGTKIKACIPLEREKKKRTDDFGFVFVLDIRSDIFG